jgi:chemotaxis protein histidine kinase CheA/ActR/RegA family two-component response regulator
MADRNPGAGAFERLNQTAAALLDPLVDPRLAEQPVLQARRLGEALMLCAQAAERAGVRGFSHLATLAVPHLQTLAGQGAWLPCRDAVEAWIGALIAFCAGHLPASEAGTLMAALRELPGFPAVPPQFVTLIERRLASDAERIAGLAAAGADVGLAGSGPVDARRPAPVMPEAPVPVARDELDMLAQALQALADESAALLSALPLSADGAAETGRREWLDLVAERLRHWINAAGYIGLAPLSELVGLAVQSVTRWADQTGLAGAAADAAQRDRVTWLPGALADFLLSMAEDRARAVCRGLADPRWPVALADDQIAQAVAAITCWRLVPSRQVQARDTPITEDDLSLRVPADADPQVVDNLLRELPGLSGGLADAVQAMAEDPGPALADAQRAAHTLKGSANTVGIRGIATLAHQLEDLLALHARRAGGPPADALALLEEGADTLAEMCEAVAGQGPAPAAAFAVAGRLAAAVAALAADAQPAAHANADADAGAGAGAGAGAAVQVDEAGGQPEAGGPPHDPARDAAAPATSLLAGPMPQADTDTASARPDEMRDETRDEPLRVQAAELDRMLELASQAAMLLAQSQEELARLQQTRAALRTESERLQDLAIELERVVDLRSLLVDRDAGQAGFDALELDRYDDLHTVSRRIAEAGADSRLIDRQLDHHVAALGDAIGQLERVQTDLSETVMQSRMVPVATIVPRLQRAVRQAARMGSRRARLEIAGDATAVDAQLLQSLVDPLVHLLRNAVSHGIEAPDERALAGKPEVGTVRLAFAHTGRELSVTCRDDGRGLDEVRIIAQARARGLLAADAPAPDAARIARLVLAPGFSTREAATQLAGRGIGLDVVQRAVAGLRGRLSLASEPGRGLAVTLSLPVSMAGLPVLVARTATHVLALSVRQVEHILPGAQPYPGADGQPVIDTPQGPVPARRLDTLLGLPAGWLSRVDPALAAQADAPPPAEAVLVVRGHDGEALALIGPALAQTRRVVLRPLPSWLPRLPGVEGACVLGDGSAAAVIDLPQLLAAGGMRAADATLPVVLPEAPRAPLCLVVDDSVSVRRATEAFVQDLGLRALGAGDGLEALARARAEVPALAIVDLEMPRMNGVEMVRALRADAQLRAVPVIMITSRASEKHRRLALEVGVDAFLTKPYTEDELAVQIRACLERHLTLG